jgi:hypothetical protein
MATVPTLNWFRNITLKFQLVMLEVFLACLRQAGYLRDVMQAQFYFLIYGMLGSSSAAFKQRHVSGVVGPAF